MDVYSEVNVLTINLELFNRIQSVAAQTSAMVALLAVVHQVAPFTLEGEPVTLMEGMLQ